MDIEQVQSIYGIVGKPPKLMDFKEKPKPPTRRERRENVVNFDRAARDDFICGFHARKVARRNEAIARGAERAAEAARLEKEARKQAKKEAMPNVPTPVNMRTLTVEEIKARIDSNKKRAVRELRASRTPGKHTSKGRK